MEEKKATKKVILEYIKVIVTTVLISYMVLSVFQLSRISGSSMEPQYQDDDLVMIEKMFYKMSQPKYDDIVVASYQNEFLEETLIIKRVIGLPGDKIEFIDNQLYRNGKLIKEDYINETMIQEDMKINVPKNTVFLLGDNRNISKDSRVIGCVDIEEDIIGKVIFELF